MQKLGIVRNMINQESLQAGGATRDQRVVDELCTILKRGCTLEEFKKATSEFMQQQTLNEDPREEKKASEDDHIIHHEIDDSFFSTIGVHGWSVLHAACT